MSSPVPGLRLLYTPQAGGQEDDLDLDENVVWNTCEEDEETIRASSDDEESGSEDDEAAAKSGYPDDDEITLSASPSTRKSSMPRTIAQCDTRNRTGIATLLKTSMDPHKKPRTVSQSLGRLELGRRGMGDFPERRTLFPTNLKNNEVEDDGANRLNLERFGSFREGFVPPHVYAVTHSTYSSTSGGGYMEQRFNGQTVERTSVDGNVNGENFGSIVGSVKGHVLKGRDALKARTAVLRSTGFLERELPGTPRGDMEAPRQPGRSTPSPISGFEVASPGKVAGRT